MAVKNVFFLGIGGGPAVENSSHSLAIHSLAINALLGPSFDCPERRAAGPSFSTQAVRNLILLRLTCRPDSTIYVAQYFAVIGITQATTQC